MLTEMFNWVANFVQANLMGIFIILSVLGFALIFVFFPNNVFIILSVLGFSLLSVLLKKCFNLKFQCILWIISYMAIIYIIASFFIYQNIIINLENSAKQEQQIKHDNTIKKEPINNNSSQENTAKKDFFKILMIFLTKIVENTGFLSGMTFIVCFFGFSVYALFCFQPLFCQSKEQNRETENSDKEKPESEPKQSRTFVIYSALLTRLLIVSFASSTLPTGVSLILCALFESIKIEHMTGLEVYLVYAGFALIFMTVIVIIEEISRLIELFNDHSSKKN